MESVLSNFARASLTALTIHLTDYLARYMKVGALNSHVSVHTASTHDLLYIANPPDRIQTVVFYQIYFMFIHEVKLNKYIHNTSYKDTLF